MGASRRRARAEPRRPNHRSSPRRFAELGSACLGARRRPPDVGLSSRAAAGCRTAATCGPGAGMERARRGDMGRAGACRPRSPRQLSGACASGAHPASSANVGSASASTGIGATTGAAAGSRKLGRDPGTARANLGRAAAGSPCGPAAASRTGSSSRASSRRATTSGSSRARSDLGIAARRAAGAAFFGGRWLGAASAVMGRGAPGTPHARTRRDRLGIAACNPAGSPSDTAGAFLERACGSLLVGRRQDRGARGSAGAVVGRAISRAIRSDPAGTAAGSRMGASSRWDDFSRPRRRRRCARRRCSRIPRACRTCCACTRSTCSGPAALGSPRRRGRRAPCVRGAGPRHRRHDTRGNGLGGARVNDVDARMAAAARHPGGDPRHGSHGRPYATHHPRHAGRWSPG
jgi:hypothetical protein